MEHQCKEPLPAKLPEGRSSFECCGIGTLELVFRRTSGHWALR